MRLRRARMADSDKLFAWANDVETRMNSRSSVMIPLADHRHWMKVNVDPGHPDQSVIVAEDGRGLIGVIRLSSRDTHDNCEVGINIAPDRRGEGNGRKFLALACARMKGFLVAEIKSTNLPSRKIFEQCGFERVSEHKGYILYRRPPIETV